jgi:predicted ester cyclase
MISILTKALLGLGVLSMTGIPKTTDMHSNKAAIRRLYEEVLNKKNFQLAEELFSPRFEVAGAAPGAGPAANSQKGAQAFLAPIRPLLEAFPDIHYDIEDMVEEGDQLAVRWTWKGTQTGTFRDIVATGTAVVNDGMAIYTLHDGKIIAINTQTDRLGFLQSLGILPPQITGRSAANVEFIDNFLIPAAARDQFLERVKINRAFLKTLPGFLGDNAYERLNEKGEIVFITIARWADAAALEKAKTLVQSEYQREGFSPAAFMERLGIRMERGVYTQLKDAGNP